jgi:hypothetical protein
MTVRPCSLEASPLSQCLSSEELCARSLYLEDGREILTVRPCSLEASPLSQCLNSEELCAKSLYYRMGGTS